MHPIEHLRFVARSSTTDTGLVIEAASALERFADDPAGLVVACRRIVERHCESGQIWSLCARVLVAADPGEEARCVASELASDPTSRRLRDSLQLGTVLVSFGSAAVLWPALQGRADVRILLVGEPQPRSIAQHLLDDGGSAEPGRLVDLGFDRLGPALRQAQVLLLESVAWSASGFLVPIGSYVAAASAARLGVPVWVAAPVGTALPVKLWQSAVAGVVPTSEAWHGRFEVLEPDVVDDVVGPGGRQPLATALKRTDCPLAPGLLR